jgi:murein L,D-transpeptidase YafK
MKISSAARRNILLGATFALLVLGAYVVYAATREAPAASPAPQPPLDAAALKGNLAIVISKSDSVLVLFHDGKDVKRYPIILGAAKGDKEVEGDMKTPEGVFYICTRNPASQFHLSLGLSYPNVEDAERGLKNGLITRAEYRKIVEAIESRATPPWNTKLGGEIFIHGESESLGGTLGCIALSNKDIEELYPLVKTGTKVEIRP